MPLTVGSHLGPYEILAPLGEGGMGEVYRARDTRLDRAVAIKILRPELAAAADGLQRFVREAQTLAALNHPHIAQIHGLEVDGKFSDVTGSPMRALVMEFVDGEDLSTVIVRGPLPLDEAIAIAQQIAEALEAAHEQGIVHRDLKPANVKRRADGTIKVLDFGLAKALEPASASNASDRALTITTPAMTAAGVILGTAAYMSPEQARGKPVDKRADIWAFGVILYEMLTGERPFAGETVTDVLASIVAREPEWSRLPVSVPRAVRELLQRCLDKDAKQRLRDIGEARVALSRRDALGDAAPVQASTPHRRVILPWIAAALAIIAAIAVWVVRQPQDPPVRKVELASGEPGLWRLSPDGTRIAMWGAGGISIRNLVDLETRAIVSLAYGPQSRLAWSPKSDALAYSHPDGNVWIVPATGGSPRVICRIPETRQAMALAWRPDDTILMPVWRGSLYAVPVSGGEPKTLVALDPKKEVDLHAVVLLPDNRLLVQTHVMAPGNAELATEVLNADGTRETAVSSDFLPTAFADGYVFFKRENVSRGIWAFRWTGTLPLRVEEGFLVAPDGDMASVGGGSLLYEQIADKSVPAQLAWLDRSGRVLEMLGGQRDRVIDMVISPDGTRIAYSAGDRDGRQIWLRDLQANGETRLTSGTGERLQPFFAPDGQRLFYGEWGRIGNERIVTIRADGSGGAQTLVRGVAPITSHDGRHLIYAVDERGRTHLRVAPILADGRIGDGQRMLKAEPEPSVDNYALSPDGNYLAYTEHFSTDSHDIFITRFPSGEGRWPVSSGGGQFPAWTKQGELLFMGGNSQPGMRMMVVPVTTAPSLTLRAPAKLFDLSSELVPGTSWLDGVTRGFDVTADGQRLLMARHVPGAASAPRHVLVQNWLSEFRNRRRRSERE